MKKAILIAGRMPDISGVPPVIITFIILILAIAAIFCWQENRGVKICFQDNCYFAEIAESAIDRERGLSSRKKLAQDKGMFFIFEKEGIYPFWMKDMNFPLDIIWLDKNCKIVFIAKNVQICDSECEKITSDNEVRYVLEINVGEADRIGLKEGSVMSVKK